MHERGTKTLDKMFFKYQKISIQHQQSWYYLIFFLTTFIIFLFLYLHQIANLNQHVYENMHKKLNLDVEASW